MTHRESDRRIVPLLADIQSVDCKSGNTDEGKASGQLRDRDRALSVHSDGTPMLTRLDRISQRAEGDSKAVFNNLFSLVDFKLLYKAFGRLKKGKAPGVGRRHAGGLRREPALQFAGLIENAFIAAAIARNQACVRTSRKGMGKTRPLGIASVEDKPCPTRVGDDSGTDLRSRFFTRLLMVTVPANHVTRL